MNKPTLIYDNECPLCVRFSQALNKLEATAHIQAIPLQNPEVYEMFPDLSYEDTVKELHLIDNDTTYRGSQVIEYLITLSPLVKKFSWLIESESSKKTLNIFYQTANLYREALRKRCTKCNKGRHTEI